MSVGLMKYQVRDLNKRLDEMVEERDQLRQQLAAVTAERDAWKQQADDERKSMRSALAIMQQRAESAETQLDTVTLAANRNAELITGYRAQLALVERYGADQWRRGNAGKEPQEFDEWRRETAADRRAAFNGGEI